MRAQKKSSRRATLSRHLSAGTNRAQSTRHAPARVCRALVPVLAVILLLIALSPVAPPAHANIFTKILREAGEAGGKAGRHGLDIPAPIARLVAKLPQRPGHLALVAHATPDGHWKFVNRNGDVFTAATPEEMARVATTLSPPGTSSSTKLSLYLTEETLFEHARFLDLLPKAGTRNIVVGSQSFPIYSVRTAIVTRHTAIVRPNLVVPLTNRKAFAEAIWQLSRPLNKADIRVLSLQPGARATLPPTPRFDKTTRQAMVDVIDPDALRHAMSAVRAQTLLVSGEIRAGALHFAPATGSPRSINLAHLREAAANADVNLIILQSSVPSQPGGRNWLWQTIEVGGLKDALNRATYADFLSALGNGAGTRFRVTATHQGSGRVIIEAIPQAEVATIPYSDVVGGWLGDVTSSLTGNVVTTAVTALLRDKERQQELDIRIIPGIPSVYQMFYLASIIAGLFAWTVSREVWGMIWQTERRAEYRTAMGYFAARLVKAVVFLLIFLPVAGIPLLALSLCLQIWTVLGWIWAVLTYPIRLWQRMRAPTP